MGPTKEGLGVGVGEYRSRVYNQRPDYADFAAPEKFMAIESIIAKRLIEHPNAMCSYSGGSDSDIMLDLIERVRKMFGLPEVEYIFFNDGLQMEATKRHVREQEEKYKIKVTTVRSKRSIVTVVRKFGVPFLSKLMSRGIDQLQRTGLPLSLHDEYWAAEDKEKKRAELRERFPKCESAINFLCCCKTDGTPIPNAQSSIGSKLYLLDFIRENPIPFKVSSRCCELCKEQTAHEVEKRYEMVITGERRDEGGMRSMPTGGNTAMCFTETASGKYRMKPLYYVSDADKDWYKRQYGIVYSDAYEVYGLKRTGCCGCPISYRAAEDLEIIRPYEPQLVKAAWNVFGESYRYRQKYVEYKAERMRRENRGVCEGQCSIFDDGD